jgi:hypothetical protein
MNIVIPAYIVDESKIDIILDQIYVTIESYYSYGNAGKFFIFTNSLIVADNINHYKTVFERDVTIVEIDFEKEWKLLNLPINEARTRRNFIIAKLIIPFIFDEEFLLLDWDILTLGHIPPEYLKSDKLRLFNPKFYDGLTLRQISCLKGLHPDSNIGNYRWMNSGMLYSPKGLALELIKEYWDKYHNITEQEYKKIFLFDIIGDELIYNIMKIEGDPRIEECSQYNLNVVLRNFYYTFSNIKSIHDFGKDYPNVLNVHFAVGHVKPFNIILDDTGGLKFQIELEKYAMDKANVRWLFDMAEHRMGSFHYNALMFSIIWQYTRYSIKERLSSCSPTLSNRYLDYFNRIFVK